MAKRDGTEQLAPEFLVRINGTELEPQVVADLVAATVYEDVDAPGMFTLRLVTWNMDRLEMTWVDDPLFAEGNEVEIEMGYVDALESLMIGEITGLEPEFAAEEVPMVCVRGFDRRHRLLRGRNTRSFKEMKDSDIAAQIATDVGLSSKVEDTSVTHSHLLQHNQTDLEFLEGRARRIGYEVIVEDKTLHFGPRRHDEGETVTLDWETDLIEFRPRLTTMTQVGEVEVRGWNPKEKAEVFALAGAGAEATKMGGSTTGPSAVVGAVGESAVGIVDRAVSTQAEADQLALGRFGEMALAYITGEGTSVGRTDLRAGTVIDIEGLGRRFSGLYYMTSTRHSYTPQQGYRTAFTVRRNAT